MKENKVFKSVYGAVLVIFIISSVMLGSRLAKLHRGNEFYRQIGGGRGFSSAVFSDSVSSGRTDASESAAMKALCLEAPELSGYVSQLAEKYSDMHVPRNTPWIHTVSAGPAFSLLLHYAHR